MGRADDLMRIQERRSTSDARRFRSSITSDIDGDNQPESNIAPSSRSVDGVEDRANLPAVRAGLEDSRWARREIGSSPSLKAPQVGLDGRSQRMVLGLGPQRDVRAHAVGTRMRRSGSRGSASA